MWALATFFSGTSVAGLRFTNEHRRIITWFCCTHIPLSVLLYCAEISSLETGLTGPLPSGTSCSCPSSSPVRSISRVHIESAVARFCVHIEGLRGLSLPKRYHSWRGHRCRPRIRLHAATTLAAQHARSTLAYQAMGFDAGACPGRLVLSTCACPYVHLHYIHIHIWLA